jgi:N-acetylglucosamine-6-phosphate deacetylase
MKTESAYAFSSIFSDGKILKNDTVRILGNFISDLSDSIGDSTDFGDRIAVPGYVDIHTHGINGIDSYDLNRQSLLEWSSTLLEKGTTGFVPTLVSSPPNKLSDFLRIISGSRGKERGAEILGGRLEGPFISKAKKGAHDASVLRLPSETDYMKELFQFKDALKIVDIAPELSGAGEMISDLVKENVVISLGHSDCDFETAEYGFSSGATLITHLYNAMKQFHHRSPGLVDFAFLEKGISAELICDLVHVSPEAVRLAILHIGRDRIVLVTDSILATNKPDGKYRLGELDVLKKGERCTLNGSDILAGSVLTMDRAAMNLRELGIKIGDITIMASRNPSRVIGRTDLGSIKKGKKANIAILDKSLKVRGVIVQGKVREF